MHFSKTRSAFVVELIIQNVLFIVEEINSKSNLARNRPMAFLDHQNYINYTNRTCLTLIADDIVKCSYVILVHVL